MNSIRGFLNQRKLPALLLVLLVASMALNIYQYFNPRVSSKYIRILRTSTIVTSPNGMGKITVTLSEGTAVPMGHRFNVTVKASLWEPYVGSKTYEFYFKIYERSLHDEYSVPIVEENVTVYKDKNEMWIELYSGNLTVTVSRTSGIYIYKVCFGTLPEYLPTFWKKDIEFPIMVFSPYIPTG